MEQNQRDLRPGWIKARDEGRELTWQQQLAERTNGVMRLPNLMTATGICLNGLGAYLACKGRLVTATATIAASFALDAEGAVARRYGLEDPGFGARFDKAADVIKAGMSAGGLVAANTLPLSAAALTYGPKVANMAVGKIAQTELVSSKTAKYAEAIRDIVPVAFLLKEIGNAYEMPAVHKAGHVLGWTAVSAAVITGTAATIGYAREAMVSRKSAGLSVHPGESLGHVEN